MNGVSIKYFVITIVSIFLALGIGIFIGFMTNGEKLLQKQFSQQIQVIDRNIALLRNENEKLLKDLNQAKDDLSQKEKLNQMLVNSYINNGNNLSNIALLVTSNDYSYNETIDFLRKNKINLIKTIKIKQSFLNNYNNLVNYIQNSDITVENKEEYIFTSITNYLLFSINNDVIKYLKDNKMIEENNYAKGIADCVLIGGGNSKGNNNFDKIDFKIIKILNKLPKLSLIGVQHSYSEENYCEKYKNNGLDTVDNIDELTGLVSMIELIRGNSGNYGVKKEATAILPGNFLNYKDSEKIIITRKQNMLSYYNQIVSSQQ
ncbi:copper transporter [Caldicellulosiruptoraceae bacterium PP1]